ncbi:CoA-binding protein [Nonomuraea sp. NPDC005650]|uniref:succinate--CoA ligase subunit alpha n=1 Tax=Nonomuraea sp. NPDC005650 TaxID=3157045 RepID=UPI0033B874B3
MSLFLDAGKAVLIQGITGRAAARHAEYMREYGTGVVAGVAPGRGGRTVGGVPVFDTVAGAVEATGARTSVAFLPPGAVGDGLVEAAEAGIELCVSVTEGVPLHDVLDGLEAAGHNGMRVIGPNCPGVLSAGRYLLGFLPAAITVPGPVAVLARSGTLSYEAVHALARHGVGVSLWAGVGGDRVKGSAFADLLPDVLDDPRTEALVLVGEIGGTDEEDVAALLDGRGLPAVALLAGASAPEGIALGHAGAIIEGGVGTVEGKRLRLEEAGIPVVRRPSEIPVALTRRGLARTGAAL